MSNLSSKIILPQSLSSYSRPDPSSASADCIPLLISNPNNNNNNNNKQAPTPTPTYHLFHLTTPPNTTHHPPRLRSSWSRLRSLDLVTWHGDAEPVVQPSSSSSSPDTSGAWTGCAINDVHTGLLHIFYTGYSLPQNGKQVVLHKVARDRHGDCFAAPDGPGEEIRIVRKKKPLCSSSSSSSSSSTSAAAVQYEDIDFRDPYIFWNEEEQKYWMLVATRLAASSPSSASSNSGHWTKGCIALLTSSDLSAGGEWEVDEQGPLYSPDDMFCPECPELWTLGGGGGNERKKNKKWYLVYSRFAGPNAGTVYRVSDSGPRGPFRTPRGGGGDGGRLDGRRWYAAKSCPKIGGGGGGRSDEAQRQEEEEEEEEKRIFFGWIADFNREDGKWLWGGDLGLPREVGVDADSEEGLLRVDIAEGVLRAIKERGKEQRRDVVEMEGVGRTVLGFPSVFGAGEVNKEGDKDTGELVDMLIEAEIKKCDAVSFGFLLDADGEMQGHRLRFTPGVAGTWTVALMDDRVPLDDFWADQYQLYIPRSVDGPEIVRHNQISIKGPIRILLRGALLECFVGGRSISYRLPEKTSQNHNQSEKTCPARVGVFVEDGEATIDVTVTVI